MDIIDIKKEGRLAKGLKIKAGCVHLEPNEEIGEHSTENGEEFILVLEGVATVMNNNEKIFLQKNQCVFIPQQSRHNVINEGKELLIYLYFVGGKS